MKIWGWPGMCEGWGVVAGGMWAEAKPLIAVPLHVILASGTWLSIRGHPTLQSSCVILSRKMRRCNLLRMRLSFLTMRRMSWMMLLACRGGRETV